MDIARDICTDSFYIVNGGLPCIAVTAVAEKQLLPVITILLPAAKATADLFLKKTPWLTDCSMMSE